MAKKIINFILVGTLLFVSIFGFCSCDPYTDKTETRRIVYQEDFVFQVREEENRAILIDLTEAGGNKEVLKVPAFVDGYPVRKIGGRRTYFGGSTKEMLKGDKVEKIYLPYTTRYVYELVFNAMNNLNELVAVFAYISANNSNIHANETYIDYDKPTLYIHQIDKFVYTQKHYETYTFSLPYYSTPSFYFLPNYIFNFNYEESPNNGTYWIDRVAKDTINLYPDDPTREGYNFGGWYLEEECITEWNKKFDNYMPEYDLTEEKNTENSTTETEQTEMQTTNIYAKWIKL